MRILATMLLTLVSLTAHADGQTPRKIGIMALSGNSMSTYNFVTQTGTRVAQLARNLVPLKNTAFDEVTVQAANKAVLKAEPATPTAMILTLDAELYQAQNAMFDSPEANKANLDYLQGLLKQRNVTHLILVTKLNADAEVKFSRSHESTGRFEGLGFYLDNGVEITEDATGQFGRGIIMPFAYVKLRLIDASTMKVVKEVYQKQSCTIGNMKGENGLYAWNAITSDEKVRNMESLLNAAMEKGVPQLLAN
ncbi:hypothetical protein AB4Z19_20910 [Pseudoduganella sp. RAF19]|uniref:hypothetical protein n=2 Tax=unclassified Pseudoduganella TaxID=2637179 RepID=UPI003F9746FA